MALVEIIAVLPALAVLAVTVFFAVEVAASFARKRPLTTDDDAPAPRIAVVIPAHNEGRSVVPTIRNVMEQLKPQDSLLVIADNCDDDTANIARRAGAHCLERRDEARRGKGFALQFALDALKESHTDKAPPDAVFFIDADCLLGPSSLEKVAKAAAASGRPVQARCLMFATEDAPARRRVAEFAWILINKVRMLGLFNAFDVARVTGTGMAFPWEIAARLDFNSSDIVEDLAMTVALTREGTPPAHCCDALVTSTFPVSDAAAVTQRARWEHGSLSVMRRRGAGDLIAGVRTGIAAGDWRLFAMAADLMIPPLTLLALIHASALALAGLLLLFGVLSPFFVMMASCLVFLIAVMVAWRAHGRDVLPLSSVGELFSYFIEKSKVYGASGRRSTTAWTRTERDAGDRNGG